MMIAIVKRLTVKLRKQTMVSSHGEPAGRPGPLRACLLPHFLGDRFVV